MNLEIHFKPFKQKWVGYVICKKQKVFADIGTFGEVFQTINEKYNELLQRYKV